MTEPLTTDQLLALDDTDLLNVDLYVLTEVSLPESRTMTRTKGQKLEVRPMFDRGLMESVRGWIAKGLLGTAPVAELPKDKSGAARVAERHGHLNALPSDLGEIDKKGHYREGKMRPGRVDASKAERVEAELEIIAQEQEQQKGKTRQELLAEYEGQELTPAELDSILAEAID